MAHSHMASRGQSRGGEGARATPGFTLPLSPQVTLSYGMFENKRNAIHVKGPFSVEADPSR